ncbi:MAG: T3SS (YopN, CesT) and YbjN peptide-binding chaperone 1, partial [Nocardioides sp.]
EAGMDDATAQAWRQFQAGLADRLAELETDDVLVVDVLVGHKPEGGAAPYVQFCAWGEQMLRAEVAGNHVLAAPYELDEAGERALLAFGYDAPTYGIDDEPDAGSLNFHLDLPQQQADRLAVMSCRALREVFGVVHPALLSADGGVAAPHEPGAAERARADEAPATFPHGGHEELTALVDAALTPYFGHPPRHDDDGDIPIDLGSTALFVRVCETVPVVEMFACVATDVQDAERAAFEVNVLNRDVRHVKFRLVGDCILADLQLPAWPFAPEQLRAMVSLMSSAVEEVSGDLQARVGGRPLLADAEVEVEDHPGEDAEPAEPAVPTGRAVAAAVLGQLEAETTGSVTPELAASICGHDVELILALIAEQEGLAASWRELRDELAGERAAAEPSLRDGGAREVGRDDLGCDHEIDHAERMATLLRRALRVVVERRAAQDDAVLPRAARTERRRSPHDRPSRRPRPRRVPDPTIEEVDPEIWG